MRAPILIQIALVVATSRATAGGFPATRDHLQWPFAQNSIWNKPIGDRAVYVPANLPPQQQVQPEEDILLLETTGPKVHVVYNGTTWRGPSRYPGTVNMNRILVNYARIPNDFVVLDKNMNYACAILMEDGVTVKQNQPFSRFPGADFATSAYVYPEDNLITGDGIKGAHGGSGMSSIGGTIRLGELLPNAPPIRHALKVTIWAEYLYYDAETKGYRWPAWKADSYAAKNYKGTQKPLRMGSLLALPAETDIASLGLQLEASVRIATALRDYGAYIVDDPVASAYGIAVERSPRGRLTEEFEKAYGQPFWTRTGPWADDMRKVFTRVCVVDNNCPESIGGGGKPRQPLAPPFAAGAASPSTADLEPPLPDKDTSAYFKFDFDPAAAERVFVEKDGLIVVEAEHYARQSHDALRKWHLTTKGLTPQVASDGDGNHAATASGGAYLEVLPDTRRNHSEPLMQNENFSEDPGRLAVLYYPVYINTPGRYYVWARTCPTGSEDNGLHVGIDGKWPGSGTRMQWIGKNSAWHWDSKQRTEKVHTGVKYRVFLDVKEPGYHTIMFSMREDGLEMDKWLMSTNKNVLKHGDLSLGPRESSLKVKNP